MALLKEIFGVCSVLFILLEARATVGYSRSTCPAVSIANKDCERVYNRCSSDEACSNGLKCCPSSRDDGCSLRCIKPRELEGCPEPLDFAFVVDTSGSISRRNFVRQREFIEQMIDGFDISEEGTHVAIVEYSSTASVVLKFNSFTGVQLNAVNLKRQARKLPHQRGYTYIDKGLHLTNTEVFSVKDGMRPNVTKIVLVMTDGRQTVDEGFLSSDILHDAVQPLKDKGIRVISLGIGKGTLLFDLLTLASTDQDVYSAADFKELKNLVTELTERNCPVHGKWSDWRGWGDCTVPCGGGQQTRYRVCDNPRPAYGGRQCPGASDETRPCNELPCAVDGGWTEWKPWEICPVTCGGGIQNRYRTCTDPPPSHGGKNCSGEGTLTRPCNEEPCPVNGNWTQWEDWRQCSVSCGGGTQSRGRTCTNPPPQFGGRDCTGESQNTRSCNDQPCPIDGRWTRWSDWEACSKSCGDGTQLSRRSCTNPSPAFGGADCEGDNVQSRPCKEMECPVDGNWTDWGYWEVCSVTCGGGVQSRTRTCTNPSPHFGGRDCVGENVEERSCNDNPCPIDGRWTRWGDWEQCSMTCGGGIQASSRSCNAPAPEFGGKDCEGDSWRSRTCNEEECPVDGKWTDWGDWELCSVTCAGGTQSRLRTCTNPPPRFGGRNCSGVGQDVRSCNEDPCPIDGRWTRWGTWEPCPVSCGGGIQLSKRSCTDPAPAFGGDNCEGESVRSRSCNERGCPADGNWSEWSEFTPCTLSCAGGIQNRSRTCTNPPPKNDGKYCAGESSEVRLCNTLPCPVDGGWSLFGEWGSCSLTCGGGVQDRQRTCTNPSPAFGGRPCDGSSMETRFCQQFPCPVNGRWTGWDSWSPCTVSCGGGQQERSRSCTNPPPAHGGADCEGPSKEVQSCNENHCPVDGKWTVWGNWGICSLTCGGGVQDRSRTCTNPPPAFGGAQCVGPSRSTRLCNDNPCPGDGKWSAWKPWSPCSVSCSLGTQSRSRTCTNPPPTFGGKDCVGKSDETKSCNKGPCPVNGRWARWNPWGLCPVRCGGGTQVRSRSCTNPPPAFGGANCIGDRRQVQSCNEQPCEVHGNWARWQSWSKCSKSCGGGDQSRMRTCTNPPPLHGGRQCSGRNKETRFCNRRPCPVDGNWADWKQWSRCSRSCGGGTQIRLRTCTNPPRSNGGSWCIGSQQERQSCNEDKLCPVDGGWSFWSYWGRCSVSCGSGVMYRTRTCTSPPPAHGGARCRGESREIYYCERSSCPVDGNWAQWGRFSRCSRRCSGGVKRRYRSCSNPRPSNGGKQCPGEAVEEIPCNTRPCSVNGNWGRWDSWSPCSKTCGGLGRRIRRRQCNNPPPSNGGRYCVGDSTLTASCAAWLPCEVSCNIPLDFAIIADTSGSISRKNFQLLQNFIRGLVDSFQVDEDYTHIAIIEYSTTASVQLHFNDLSGKNLTRQNVKEKVQSMPHKRGYTYIDRALRMADRDVFTYAAGMRYNVDKVALVMTDGVQTVEKNSGKSDIEILTEASKPLKEKGVRIISLGIGKRVNRRSLEAISSGRDVYSSRTFSELKTLVKKLKKGTCHATAAGYKYVRRTR